MTQTTPNPYFNKLFNYLKKLLDKPDIIKNGRPSKLADYELISLMIWSKNHGLDSQGIKGAYRNLKREFKDNFNWPSYENFSRHCLRLLPKIEQVSNDLTKLVNKQVIHLDSTSLPVCHK